jgi:phage terminase large subunit-like protein
VYADRKHFLIDLVRKQRGYPTLSQLLLKQYAKHKPNALLIEDHGSGTALTDTSLRARTSARL